MKRSYASISCSDHRSHLRRLPLGLFYPESKAHGLLWVREEWRLEVAWVDHCFYFSEYACEWSSASFWGLRDWGSGRFSSWSGIARIVRGTWTPVWVPPELFIWSPSAGWVETHIPEVGFARRWGTWSVCLECCLWAPGSRTLSWGATLQTSDTGRSWVLRGLCEAMVEYCSVGPWLRDLACPWSHWMIFTMIWATGILFFHLRIWKIFGPNERFASWVGPGIMP